MSVDLDARHRELLAHVGVVFNQVEALYHYLLQFPLAGQARAGLDPPQQAAAQLVAPVPPRLPAEQFLADWIDGALPYPFQPCTNQQLYRAFLRWWLERGDERAPPSQTVFTCRAAQWEKARPVPRAITKTVALGHGKERKATRCWIPTGAGPTRAGVTEGEWMLLEIERFEPALARPLRVVGGSQ